MSTDPFSYEYKYRRCKLDLWKSSVDLEDIQAFVLDLATSSCAGSTSFLKP